MANIVRCELPNGVHRFKPFTVEDYRDFLLVRNDMTNRTDEEQKQLVNELANDYFYDYPKSWQQYIFLKVFTSSIGKTKIPVNYECPICGKKTKRIFNLEQTPLVNPTIEINEFTKLYFDFPDEIETNPTKLFLDNIKIVEHENTKYKWDDLTDETKESIVEAIDFVQFENLIKNLSPINFSMKMKCCDKESNLIYNDLHSIFSFLLNPDEVFSFYETNNVLVKNNYDLNSIMKMIPIERGIALKLIEKEMKTK